MSMIGTSSSGFGQQPKTRSLDLEANLLAERIQERQAVFAASKKALALILLLVFASVLILPYLAGKVATKRADYLKANKRALALAAQLQEAKAAKDAASQTLVFNNMLNETKARAETFCGRIILLLNLVPPNVALSTMKAEVLGGELQIRSVADAESLSGARSFVQQAANIPASKDSLLVSAKRNDTLADGGVGFEFIHRAQVGR